MSRLSPLSTLEPQFDAFLFASIGDDENGLSLSVLSALARMGLDPWQEASALAALPAVAAAERFALLFRSLPNESLSDAERAALTTRLIGLLPRPIRREPGKLLTLPYSRRTDSCGSTTVAGSPVCHGATYLLDAEQRRPSCNFHGGLARDIDSGTGRVTTL
jgi:hypothetical protein